MNQRLWNGLTAVLLTTALSTTSSCQAQQTKAVAEEPEASYSAVGSRDSNPSLPSQTGQKSLPAGSGGSSPSTPNQTGETALPQTESQPVEAVKVGEYQSNPATPGAAETIAKIETHEIEGRKAATLYVRNIPVLTFVESAPVTPGGQEARPDIKVGQVEQGSNSNPQGQMASEASQSPADPVWRAMSVAARINQLSRDNVNANTITVRWNGEQNATASKPTPGNGRPMRDRYIIQADGQDIVQIDAETRLPDTTRNLAQDALQATNRLRRLLGGAPPVREIAGIPAPPRPPQQVSLVTVLSRFRGWASWYGPGFHGNRSASGERYNQNALTAAHRSLPFGTRVRVTNLNTGVSVIVRINDRGPFIRGRIIDLSAAAARTIGMMGSGVAPVTIEVLGPPPTVTIEDPS
jgi:rare lipoprotein A